MIFDVGDGIASFEIDRTKIDAYIEHRFNKVHKVGNETVSKVIKTRYEIRDCKASDFNGSQFERDFWEGMQPSKDNEFTYYLYCVADPNKTLSMQGPSYWDDVSKNKNFSTIHLMIKKCPDSISTENQCSSE